MTLAEAQRFWPTFAPSILVDATTATVLDQGSRKTCLAMATTTAHEIRGGFQHSLSCEYLFWSAKQRDGAPATDGTTPQSISAALETDGQPAELEWPYQRNLTWPSPGYGPPMQALAAPRHRRANRHTSDLTTAVSELHAARPPVLVLAITKSFYSPNAAGVVAPVLTEVTEAHHAVLAIGAGSLSTSTNVIVIRNSWGSAWGKNGHALLPYDYVQHCFRSALMLD